MEVNKKLINLVKNNDVVYMATGKDDNSKLSQTHRESNELREYANSLGLKIIAFKF